MRRSSTIEPCCCCREKESRFSDAQEAWLELPLSELPQEQVQKWLDQYEGPIHELQQAAMRDTCQWDLQLRQLDGLEAISFRLPELQDAQTCAVLRLKVRLEIARGQFDAALGTLQLGYTLARDLGQSPTLIHGLVGIAVATMMNTCVVDWVNADGPNLYWALTTLPENLIDLRPGIQQEMNLPLQIMPCLEDPEHQNWSEEQWRDALAEGLERMAQTSGALASVSEGQRSRRFLTQLASVGWLLAFYPQAKQALIDSGMDPQRVAQMPTGQVVAIQASRAYRHIYHENMKWFYVPFWQAREESQATLRRLEAEGYLGQRFPSREIIPIASLMMPAGQAAMSVGVRLQRDVAALRTVERFAYAAAHAGQWPTHLADVVQTPVPLDPVTGQAFPFQLQDGRGQLLLTPLPDYPKLQGKRYEIELRALNDLARFGEGEAPAEPQACLETRLGGSLALPARFPISRKAI